MLRMIIGRIVWSLFRPFGLGKLGRDVRIAFPRRLNGREYLHFADHVRVGNYSWIEGVKNYHGQRFQPKIEISSKVCIGRFAHITAVEYVHIGEGCLLSEHVFISDHIHETFNREQSPLSERPLAPKGAICIGPRCFIGIRAVIMPNVTLGEGCVVGANSVVTKSFGPGSVVAGIPAKLIRQI